MLCGVGMDSCKLTPSAAAGQSEQARLTGGQQALHVAVHLPGPKHAALLSSPTRFCRVWKFLLRLLATHNPGQAEYCPTVRRQSSRLSQHDSASASP